MLYKLENGMLKPFEGTFFEHEGKIYANPTSEQLKKAGYKRIIAEDMTECDSNHYCTAAYEETDTEIIQKWKIYEYTEETE